MRILHTSDWHLGRTLHGESLHEHQVRFHDWLVDLVAEREVDAVVIPGDVYDRAVPDVASVELLGRTLSRLARITTVILTPGNHDSAARLGFGRDLLRSGVHLLTDLPGIEHPVVLEDEHGEVLVFGLPYLEPDMVRHALTPEGEETLGRSHAAVLQAAMDRVRERIAQHARHAQRPRAIVLAHAFVAGGSASDSERDLSVGGIGSVPGSVFCGIDYLALGHLHGGQDLSALVGAPAWYSGSPLAFSFSEKDHRKSVLLLDIGAPSAGGPAEMTVERISTPVPRPLTELRGTLEEVLAEAPAHGQDWLKAIITDAARPPHLQERLHQVFPHLLLTEFDPQGRGERDLAPLVRREADPLAVMDEFFDFVTGAPPTPLEHEILDDAYSAVRAGRQEAS
ncbi:exonuclease SbcCD subunit D [Brachybacterium sp. JHP9]|uniref:Nuclease SbcCD subunit D n=1 Tax=Brachybacterium equifaecis TaxID=2910770 RepID=A0ABT0R011_9MICO|nr:exonuclease SbcCD subunit D [Brachybacterium equifaecis]MCL6423099.1 exonuclease SbcCD subunit D [Brachybacterium equifaecis]